MQIGAPTMTLKEYVLSVLNENKGSYTSGEELSKGMNVSRTAIWKAITSLREDGHKIEAVTNKGYMLISPGDPISDTALRVALSNRYRCNDIYIYDTVESTNTSAKQLALDGAPHGTVVIAHSQTAGKGRLGRSFFSPGNGIYMSVIIKPDFDLSLSGLITTAAAVAVSEAIEETCGVPALIKWVNDIYVSDKKVCGILSEGMTDFETGRIESIIIGIGLNTSVDGFSEELLSIAGAVEGDYSKSVLAANTITKLLDLINNIDDRSFIETYKKKNLVIGRKITVYKGIYKHDPNEIPSVSAYAVDIDNNGGLIVRYEDGSQETLNSGEISIRL